MPGGGTAPLGSLAWWASVFETFGGSLLLIGLYARPVAFLLSGEMAVAYFQGTRPAGFLAGSQSGTPAVMFCFIFLYLSAAGAGPWSLDALRIRARLNRRPSS